MKRMIKAGVTVLAVAVGFQIMTSILGGQAVAYAEVNDENNRPVLSAVNPDQHVQSSTGATGQSKTAQRDDNSDLSSFSGPSYRGE